MWLLTHLRRGRRFIQRTCQSKGAPNCKPYSVFCETALANTFIFTRACFYICRKRSQLIAEPTRNLFVLQRIFRTLIVKARFSFTHSYPTWCSPCSCVFNLILPQHASLFCQLFLIHADVIPAAKPLATLTGAQGRPRSTSKVADHRSVKGSSWGCGSRGGEWNLTESCKNRLWGSAGTKATQKERAQA